MRREFPCPACEMKFTDQNILDLHLMNQHPEEIVKTVMVSAASTMGELEIAVRHGKPRATAEIAEAGIATASDFVSLMGAVIQELAAGDMEPKVANAICGASAQILKMVEMKQRYGKKTEA